MLINLRYYLFLIFILIAPLHAYGAGQQIIRLATTTSTENSGLLGYVLPAFEKASGYKVHVIAVGTGKALRMGRDGDVDVVLVHARKAEDKFVADGAGLGRHAVMHNDFVLVGPAEDPARVQQSSDATSALGRIADLHATFVSRGDDSGTHKKEMSLWETAGIRPNGRWYREAGQGMGKVLQMASELGAYALTDRGTWLAYRDKSALKILFEGDERLYNPYGIIAVSPARYPDVNTQGVNALIEWLTGIPGQQRIATYRLDGEQLFQPDAIQVVHNTH